MKVRDGERKRGESRGREGGKNFGSCPRLVGEGQVAPVVAWKSVTCLLSNFIQENTEESQFPFATFLELSPGQQLESHRQVLDEARPWFVPSKPCGPSPVVSIRPFPPTAYSSPLQIFMDTSREHFLVIENDFCATKEYC